MSEAILKLGENGTLRQLEKKWFPVSLSNYAAPDDDNNQSLGLSNYTYIFVISSCLAFLTVLHRFFEVMFPGAGDQVVPLQPALPQESPAGHPMPLGQPQEVELIALHNHRPVGENGMALPNHGPVGELEMVDVPLHNEMHRPPENEQPLVPRGPHPLPNVVVNIMDDAPLHDGAPNRSDPGRRFRHAASSSIISMPARVLLSFFSFRPQHTQEIDRQPLRDSAQHEEEHPPNSSQTISNFGQRFQRAASSSNILRTNRVPQHFRSLRPQRVPEIIELQDASSDTEEQFLLEGSHEGGETASVLRKSDAELGLSGNLRRRV